MDIALVRGPERRYFQGGIMIAGRHSEDYYPLTWVGRVPIYVTTLLVIVHVAAMLAVTVAMGMTGASSAFQCPWLAPFFYSSADVVQDFKAWQFVSYAFVNEPSLWFAIDMLLLYSFGREVERLLGRRAFLWMYLALLLAAPLALTLLQIVKFPAALLPAFLGGSGPIHFAIFVAFAVIYPTAEMFFFRIQARWIALVLLGIHTLQDVAHHLWVPLFALWLDSACAVLMLRLSGVANASLDAWLPEREEPVRPARRLKNPVEPLPPPDVHESIDPLLEKISKHGIASLTKRERQQLDQARETLLEREKPSR